MVNTWSTVTNDILSRIIADEIELEEYLLDNMPIRVSITTRGQNAEDVTLIQN